jgi:hypothetical protein
MPFTPIHFSYASRIVFTAFEKMAWSGCAPPKKNTIAVYEAVGVDVFMEIPTAAAVGVKDSAMVMGGH